MAPTEAGPAVAAESPRGPTRRDPMLLWLVAAVLLLARVGLGFYETRHPQRRPDLVSWVPAADAPGLARTSGRPIFYDFSADWCGPCVKMSEEVFTDEKHAAAVSRIAVPVHVVDRQREEGRNSPWVDSLQRAYGVTAFPTLIVADADGKVLEKIEGYPGANDFVQWLGRAGVKHRLSGARGGAITFP